MFANHEIERIIFEIYTNDICREFYFVNQASIIKNLDEDDAGWLNRLDKVACQRHSDCLKQKLMDDVFKNYLNIHKYYYKYMAEIFSEFYLCHKLIPNEPFNEYCIRFGEFYQKNYKQESEEQSYTSQIIGYCLCKLIVARYEFPNFFVQTPENWTDYRFKIPPYVKIKKFDYDIYNCIEKIKENSIPIKNTCIYLFAHIGEKTKIIKISQELENMLLFSSKDQTIEESLINLTSCRSSKNYMSLKETLLILINKKYLLLSEKQC